jgi:GH15 family glucan-1,4-alpha-glucosidase
MSKEISSYALIGDCETAALVSRNGSIDWLCWPRFDSPACFAAIVGNEENGHWQIAPSHIASVRRRYRDHTLILETEFETDTGRAVLVDFMPLRDKNSDIVRIVRGLEGEVQFTMELVIRFDYGRTIPWVSRQEDDTLVAIAGPDLMVLKSDVEVRGEGMKTVADFSIKKDQSVSFTLTHGPSHISAPHSADAEGAISATEKWWREWCSRSKYDGPYADLMERSLITLKALTYQHTGGIVAAVTTSLPECLGGTRNWDYRFCWLRDATFTLFALMEAGYEEEAEAWRNWLVRTAAGSPNQLQILYGVAGERQFIEYEIPWLSGYQGSAPVRVGNAAAGQLQLDVYGEIADVLHQARSEGLPEFRPAIDLQLALTDHLAGIWREPDQGIWEMRGKRRHFTHSKVMAWVAFDRIIKGAEAFGTDGAVQRWKDIREEIHNEICREGFDPDLNSFVQFYGAREPDASLLLLPLVGFLPANDSRIAGTVKAIEERLMWDGFVHRYDTRKTEDGLPPGEGVFLACSFWLVDNYILMGRRADAERLLERLIQLANDVGLFSEEFDPQTGAFLGNFPQAFSHVALVNSVMNLNRGVTPVQKRSKQKVEARLATGHE